LFKSCVCIVYTLCLAFAFVWHNTYNSIKYCFSILLPLINLLIFIGGNIQEDPPWKPGSFHGCLYEAAQVGHCHVSVQGVNALHPHSSAERQIQHEQNHIGCPTNFTGEDSIYLQSVWYNKLHYSPRNWLKIINYRTANTLFLSYIDMLLFVCLQGMGYLHARGIVHKDLKTKNIFLENGKVVITDFGLFSVARLCYGHRQVLFLLLLFFFT
jgi:serine/threonine protein kinase